MREERDRTKRHPFATRSIAAWVTTCRVVARVRAANRTATRERSAKRLSSRNSDEKDFAMDPDFWLARWHEGRIGFHQDAPTPLMLEHWPTLGLAPGGKVFVPLCGKSRDLAWLASQGLRVLGVELSSHAVQAFFDEHGLQPTVRDTAYGRHYAAGAVEIICGDAFGLDADVLGDCDAVFDRAAIIALPRALRHRYVHELYARLPSRCRGLLITVEYPQHEKSGPPFSVTEDEVRELYARDWNVRTLDRREILAEQPAFAAEGVTTLHTAVYRLDRR
jgi:thiopurine S-methyltransferase